MTVVTAYAYPWDLLGDPAVFDRARAVGATRIAVAAVYHAVRAATPQHPLHAVVDAPGSMDFVGGGISARGMGVAAGPADATFAAAAEACRGAGFGVAAWTVLNHIDGHSAPEDTVRNAFGDPYTHAPCPRSAATQEFALAVTERVASVADDLVLEATGQLGADHQGTHDKTVHLWEDPWVHRALSWCFCAWCREAMGERGADPNELAARVRDSVRGGARPDASTTGLLDELRVRAGTSLLESVVSRARARGVSRLAVHGAPGAPTGAATALDPAAVDEWVIPAWDDPETAAARVAAARERAGEVPRAAYVSTLTPASTAERLNATVRAVTDAGAQGIHLYHLGLSTAARWEAAVEALRPGTATATDAPNSERKSGK